MSVPKTNVIEWANAGPDDILWVYPYEDIRWGSVVVVHEYETAILMRDGKAYDVLGPGRHTLNTQNLPLLTRAYRLVMGYGETPFKVTVIFLALKQFKGRFGTNTRVKLSPNALYTTELQSYGNFWFRVSDAVLFLTQLAGGAKTLSTQDVTNFIRSFFTELFMQELGKHAATDIYTRLEEVSRKIKADVIPEAFKQRGLELVDLKVEGASLPLLEKMEKEDPTYGLPLLMAMQNGRESDVLQLVKTVESMRALGKSSGAGFMGALFAIPQMLGAPPQQYPPPQAYGPQSAGGTPQPTAPSAQAKTPVEKLRELKQMLDEGLITQEEFDKTKQQILGEFKKS